jgi:hypothetical protein
VRSSVVVITLFLATLLKLSALGLSTLAQGSDCTRQMDQILSATPESESLLEEKLRRITEELSSPHPVLRDGNRLTLGKLPTLNDEPVRLRPESGGANNFALYSYLAPDGTQRFIKILDIPEPTGIRKFLKVLEGSYLLEKVGGPKVHGFGKLKGTREEPGRYYVEMEHLFAGESATTLKEGARKLLLEKDPAGLATVENIADGVIRTYIEQIYPRDPDFLVAPGGRATWIDGGLWERAEPGSRYLHQIAYTINVLAGYMQDDREAIRLFLSRVIARLHSLDSRPEADRIELLQTIFLDDSIRSLNVPDKVLENRVNQLVNYR